MGRSMSMMGATPTSLGWAGRPALPLLLADGVGTTELTIGVGLLVAGVVALLTIPRVSPKGTLLVVAAVLYVLSWVIQPGTMRQCTASSG